IVKKIMAKAGIKESVHALRKTGATIYYQQSGYDLMATQRFLGHASPSVTHRYIGVTPEQANEYAQRASIALIAAVETGESEKLNTIHNML
ncbi:MAG: tyrosine-type recombinase/integrase, partial [Candidatus Poribacteria bacterium]